MQFAFLAIDMADTARGCVTSGRLSPVDVRRLGVRSRPTETPSQQEAYGQEVPAFPSAREVWEESGMSDHYVLFRWKSDPSHASAVTMGAMVALADEENVQLGGKNRPSDRARGLGATFMLMKLVGPPLLDGLRIESGDWLKAAEAAEAEMSKKLIPVLQSEEN